MIGDIRNLHSSSQRESPFDRSVLPSPSGYRGNFSRIGTPPIDARNLRRFALSNRPTPSASPAPFSNERVTPLEFIPIQPSLPGSVFSLSETAAPSRDQKEVLRELLNSLQEILKPCIFESTPHHLITGFEGKINGLRLWYPDCYKQIVQGLGLGLNPNLLELEMIDLENADDFQEEQCIILSNIQERNVFYKDVEKVIEGILDETSPFLPFKEIKGNPPQNEVTPAFQVSVSTRSPPARNVISRAMSAFRNLFSISPYKVVPINTPMEE